MIQAILHRIWRWRTVIFWLLGLGLFGYTLFKVQAISNPAPDAEYLRKQQAAKPAEIKIKPELRAELERLVETPVDINSDSSGHGDPFNP